MIVLIALTVVLIVLSIRWYWTKLKVILNLNIPTLQNFIPIIGHGHKLIGLSAEGIIVYNKIKTIKHLPSPASTIRRTFFYFQNSLLF